MQVAGQSELDAKTKSAIETIKKGGELTWSTATPAPAATSSVEGLPMVRNWSIEPNGYQRLKMTCQIDPIGDLGNELTLERRFAVRELATVSLWDRLGAFLIAISVLTLGLWRSKAIYERRRLIASLSEWANLSMQTSPSSALLVADSPNSVESFDPGVARILLRATEGMQKRLEAVQHSVEQSSRVMSAMPVGVFAFDQKLKLLFVNRAGRELLGLGASFQFGQDLMEVIRQPTVVNLIQEVAAEPQIQETELELPLSKVTLRLRASLVGT